MAGLAFDTLDASKTLRSAGVDERAAEAIVQIVQRTTEMPDISHLEDAIAQIRRDMATKEDVDAIRNEMATKTDLADVRLEIAELRGEVRRIAPELRAEFSERMRTHLFATLAYMTALIGAAVAVLKFVG